MSKVRLCPTAGTNRPSPGTADTAWEWGSTPPMRGNVYGADSTSHAIRKVTPAGVVTTLAGLAGVEDWADGDGRN